MSTIRISNTISQVTREINHAPEESYISEAIRNALEAIGDKIPGIIRICSFDPSMLGEEFEYQHSKKLCIFNNVNDETGGLNAKQLRDATDLSSSLNKLHGLTEHFGRGIKVTALKGNPEGFLWGSKCGDKKFLVWLRKNEKGEYERYDWYQTIADSDTGFIDVLDISDVEMPFDDYKGDYNFYVFLGKEHKQNTVQNPYNSHTPPRPGWLINTIYKRFWSWPNNVELKMEVGHSKGKGAVKFTNLPKHLEKLKSKGVKVETVKIPDSTIEVSYVFDPEYAGVSADDNQGRATSVVGAPMTATPFSGIVYKGELHDVTDGNELKAVARSYGIPFGCKYLRAYVHLPVSSDYEHDADRQYIRKNDEKRTLINQFNYSHLVRENKPDWFQEEIEKFIPDFSNTNLQEELQKYAESLEIFSKNGGSGNGGLSGPPDGTKKRNGDASGTKQSDSKKKRSKEGSRLSTVPAPTIEHLHTAKDVENSSAENIKNRAAQFDLDQNILYLNYTYPTCANVIEKIIDDYCNSPVIDSLENTIRNIVKDRFGLHIGMLVIHGYQKQVNKFWTYEDIVESTSPNALSNHIDAQMGSTLLPTLELEISKISATLEKASRQSTKELVEA